jgi:hypothetical protein
MQRQRINNFNALYLMKVPANASRALRDKGVRDRVKRAYDLEPVETYYPANYITRAPEAFHEPLPIHKRPQHLNPMFSIFQRGTARHNQMLNAHTLALNRMS